MENYSRIRFNPQTGEVEIEGTEKFIETNLNKLLNFLSVGPGESKKVPKAPTSQREKKSKETAAPAKKTMVDTVMGLIQKSEGITTTELKDKTGLTKRQIWGITANALKAGKIKKAKRGIYEAV